MKDDLEFGAVGTFPESATFGSLDSIKMEGNAQTKTLCCCCGCIVLYIETAETGIPRYREYRNWYPVS
ncbi:hypothetical protein BU16DRAFT_557460 [Lophium mytilinum]|uniref:Uncharacterized protein n=1 Tax=Lophium mytilinum TaxID=390894 RepID=A0A6A6R490_9PEZI|nr:hypothetical protein BU16DRAFT_557460 [Lophium mytilinum]